MCCDGDHCAKAKTTDQSVYSLPFIDNFEDAGHFSVFLSFHIISVYSATS